MNRLAKMELLKAAARDKEVHDRPRHEEERAPMNVIMPTMPYDGITYGIDFRGGQRGIREDDYVRERRMGFDGGYHTDGDRIERNSRNLYFDGSSHHHSSEHKLTKEQAHEWAEKMKNADGSSGAHWSMEQTKALREKIGVNVDPVEFFLAANMIYSDYCAVAKKFGVDNSEFYGHMAVAFINDKDAAPNKLLNYFEEVVEED